MSEANNPPARKPCACIEDACCGQHEGCSPETCEGLRVPPSDAAFRELLDELVFRARGFGEGAAEKEAAARAAVEEARRAEVERLRADLRTAHEIANAAAHLAMDREKERDEARAEREALRGALRETHDLLSECAPLTDHARSAIDRPCHKTCLRCAVDRALSSSPAPGPETAVTHENLRRSMTPDKIRRVRDYRNRTGCLITEARRAILLGLDLSAPASQPEGGDKEGGHA